MCASIPSESHKRKIGLLVIFCVAAVLWAINVWKPIDGTIEELWREPAVGSIARNFYEEDMNILHPRIHWRGDGSGLVESEFPLYAWMVACLYHVFGYQEELARILSYVLFLASCLMFFRLACYLLPESGVLPSCLFFVLNPLALYLADRVQAEPVMFFAYVSSVYFFLKWSDSKQPRYYWCAYLFTVLAILAKLPAIHLGILFTAIVIDRLGWRALFKKDALLFAAGALLIPLVWYAYAKSLWMEHGNSLGISNEAFNRITSMNFMAAFKTTIPNIIRIEAVNIWMHSGMILGLFALPSLHRQRNTRILLYWLGTLAIFYFVTGRTTGESWAFYYHIVSLPPAALTIGYAVSMIMRPNVKDLYMRILTVSAALSGAIITALVAAHFSRESSTVQYWGIASVVVGTVMVLPVLLSLHAKRNTRKGAHSFALGSLFMIYIIVMLYTATLLLEIRYAWRGLALARAPVNALYECAKNFEREIPKDDLIIASGTSGIDQFGIPKDHAAPYMFFWMNRKGFSLSEEDQDMATIQALHKRGARYFVAEKSTLMASPSFSEDVKERLSLIQECSHAYLFRIDEMHK